MRSYLPFTTLTLTPPVNVTVGFPFAASFVVMRTTPFAPWDPYIAVADASLRISMEAISSGLRPIRPFTSSSIPSSPPPRVPTEISPEVFMIIPSTTYKGCELELNELAPRMMTLTPPSGAPL